LAQFSRWGNVLGKRPVLHFADRENHVLSWFGTYNVFCNRYSDEHIEIFIRFASPADRREEVNPFKPAVFLAAVFLVCRLAAAPVE
jgi:hypothetical protein